MDWPRLVLCALHRKHVPCLLDIECWSCICWFDILNKIFPLNSGKWKSPVWLLGKRALAQFSIAKLPSNRKWLTVYRTSNPCSYMLFAAVPFFIGILCSTFCREYLTIAAHLLWPTGDLPWCEGTMYRIKCTVAIGMSSTMIRWTWFYIGNQE